MKEWTGVITSNDLSMTATVYYQKPPEHLVGNWYGNGTADDWCSSNLLGATLETNIGRIIIKSITNGKHVQFECVGDAPIGPLADALGINY